VRRNSSGRAGFNNRNNVNRTNNLNPGLNYEEQIGDDGEGRPRRQSGGSDVADQKYTRDEVLRYDKKGVIYHKVCGWLDTIRVYTAKPFLRTEEEILTAFDSILKEGDSLGYRTVVSARDF
jgi:hypothetical protein